MYLVLEEEKWADTVEKKNAPIASRRCRVKRRVQPVLGPEEVELWSRACGHKGSRQDLQVGADDGESYEVENPREVAVVLLGGLLGGAASFLERAYSDLNRPSKPRLLEGSDNVGLKPRPKCSALAISSARYSVEWVSLSCSRSVRVCACWNGEPFTVSSSAGLPSLASEAPLADAASVASECRWHNSTQI